MSVEGLERFPSARDIEKVARNPDCRTLRVAMAANIDLRKYAIKIGLPEERQSPLAIARGEQVERYILGKDAQVLVAKFVEDGKLDTSASVVDLGRHRSKNRQGMSKAADQADMYIREGHAGRKVPDVIIHPVLKLPLGRDVQYIEPDALVRYKGSTSYEPLELKSYPFREGRTDRVDLRQARRQGAVYVHALRGRVAALDGDVSLVRPQVTLVFTKPNSLFPHPIYSESVQGEMRDIEHAVELLDSERHDVVARKDKGEDIVALLPSLETNYLEQCLAFCSLAKLCRAQANAAGQVCVLGEQVSSVLKPAATIERAIDLLNGIKPVTDDEKVLLGRLREIADRIGPFPPAT